MSIIHILTEDINHDLSETLKGFTYDFSTPDRSIANALRRCQANGIYSPAQDIVPKGDYSLQVIEKWKGVIAQSLSI